MVEAEEHAISYPIPPAKHSSHLRQQYASEQELLSENHVEYGADQKQNEEPIWVADRLKVFMFESPLGCLA
jgi:hypothetical protein